MGKCPPECFVMLFLSINQKHNIMTYDVMLRSYDLFSIFNVKFMGLRFAYLNVSRLRYLLFIFLNLDVWLVEVLGC